MATGSVGEPDEQREGFRPRRAEFRDAQRRLHQAGAGRPRIGRRRRMQGLAVGVERVGVAALGEEFMTELKLDLSGLRLRRHIGQRDEATRPPPLRISRSHERRCTSILRAKCQNRSP